MVCDYILDILQISWHWDTAASPNEEVLFILLAYDTIFLLSIEEYKNYHGMVPPSNYLESPKLTSSELYLVYGQNFSEFHFLKSPSCDSLVSPETSHMGPKVTFKGKLPGFWKTVQVTMQLSKVKQSRTNCNLLTKGNQSRNESQLSRHLRGTICNEVSLQLHYEVTYHPFKAYHWRGVNVLWKSVWLNL